MYKFYFVSFRIVVVWQKSNEGDRGGIREGGLKKQWSSDFHLREKEKATQGEGRAVMKKTQKHKRERGGAETIKMLMA